MNNRRLLKTLAVLPVYLLLLANPAFAQIEMARVATIPGGLSGTLPCGNLYHDGHVELVGSVGNDMEVIEDTGWNRYRVQHIHNFGFPSDYAFALGCGNGDGLTELITQQAETLEVWKQVAPESFPSRRVWDTLMLYYQCDRIEFCDLDKDGHAEILANDYGYDFLWEDRGGNTYEPVPFPTQSWWRLGPTEPAIGDFDGDGFMEIGGGGCNSDEYGCGLAFFECCGNDLYVPTCTMPEPPGQSWDPPASCAAARNMEGDGLSEFVSAQVGFDSEAGLILLRIVKEPVHNQFVCVCTLEFSLGPWLGPHVAAGDVDGDDRDEIAVSTINDVRIVKYAGPGQYVTECIIDKPNVTNLRMFDLNQDGRSELIFATDSTYIYEDTNGLGVAEFTKLPQVHTVTVQPTIARLGAPVLFSGVSPGSDIEVLSIDGRLVTKTQEVRQSSWVWDLRNQSGDLVPAGTYFAVIRSKGKATSLKLCVVK